ncbi:MAG: hypothetical protein CL840_00380 [Crocinitomicaceae bacterium]|nr:hypothetical protein [Crocinitomicaceae bacterium]|tara:strand:- start:192178 stop:192774 length:597 start_codon:yes stop_codon:yes gene_type:complete
MHCIYQETSFLMPNTGQGNADVWHKQIIDLMTDGKNQEGIQYLFKKDFSQQLPESALIKLRAATLPDALRPTEKRVEFACGADIKLKLRLCTTRRKKQVVSGKEKTVESFISPSDEGFVDFLSAMLSNNGFELKEIISTSELVVEPIKKTKGGRSFVPWCDVHFTATVNNEESASVAYIKGIGRKKVFGTGMLEVISE